MKPTQFGASRRADRPRLLLRAELPWLSPKQPYRGSNGPRLRNGARHSRSPASRSSSAAAGVDILLTHPLVSRQHARIIRGDQREGPAFVVIDLESSHGTWVNGVRIDRRPLRPRDRIRLGQQGVELLYLVEDDSKTIREPKPWNRDCSRSWISSCRARARRTTLPSC
jgi:hypothetical protein